MSSTPSDPERFDLVVFGATSFVGQLVVEHLARRSDAGVTWAAAGRDADKLDRVLDKHGVDVPTIVADAADRDAMADLVARAHVVMSTVGPYALYGSELVAAAAAAGTDYCDLTGEPQWVRRMIDAHQETAVASGARLVPSCGFDSIPSDLGTWFTQQRSLERFGKPCVRVAMRVKDARGGFSGGTVASGLNVLDEMSADRSLRKLLADPYALAPAGHREGVDQPNVTIPSRDDLSGEWVAPFVMAAVNTKVVHRTHALLGHPWGEFRYDEAMAMGEGPLGAVKAGTVAGALGGVAVLGSFGPVRSLMRRVVPAPGTGPSPATQEAGYFDVRFFGKTAAGHRIQTQVTGDRDPGYGSTAKMLTEAAIVLRARSRDDVGGGFHTPTTAMGDELIEALVSHAGMTFEEVGHT